MEAFAKYMGVSTTAASGIAGFAIIVLIAGIIVASIYIAKAVNDDDDDDTSAAPPLPVVTVLPSPVAPTPVIPVPEYVSIAPTGTVYSLGVNIPYELKFNSPVNITALVLKNQGTATTTFSALVPKDEDFSTYSFYALASNVGTLLVTIDASTVVVQAFDDSDISLPSTATVSSLSIDVILPGAVIKVKMGTETDNNSSDNNLRIASNGEENFLATHDVSLTMNRIWKSDPLIEGTFTNDERDMSLVSLESTVFLGNDSELTLYASHGSDLLMSKSVDQGVTFSDFTLVVPMAEIAGGCYLQTGEVGLLTVDGKFQTSENHYASPVTFNTLALMPHMEKIGDNGLGIAYRLADNTVNFMASINGGVTFTTPVLIGAGSADANARCSVVTTATYVYVFYVDAGGLAQVAQATIADAIAGNVFSAAAPAAGAIVLTADSVFANSYFDTPALTYVVPGGAMFTSFLTNETTGGLVFSSALALDTAVTALSRPIVNGGLRIPYRKLATGSVSEVYVAQMV
jgi:hypothetical protein